MWQLCSVFLWLLWSSASLTSLLSAWQARWMAVRALMLAICSPPHTGSQSAPSAASPLHPPTSLRLVPLGPQTPCSFLKNLPRFPSLSHFSWVCLSSWHLPQFNFIVISVWLRATYSSDLTFQECGAGPVLLSLSLTVLSTVCHTVDVLSVVGLLVSHTWTSTLWEREITRGQ